MKSRWQEMEIPTWTLMEKQRWDQSQWEFRKCEWEPTYALAAARLPKECQNWTLKWIRRTLVQNWLRFGVDWMNWNSGNTGIVFDAGWCYHTGIGNGVISVGDMGANSKSRGAEHQPEMDISIGAMNVGVNGRILA